MTAQPEGLYEFTKLVLASFERNGVELPRIEPHDPDDMEGADLLWFVLTPELELSEGSYLSIAPEIADGDRFNVAFQDRVCAGGDPTWGDLFVVPTQANADKVAQVLLTHQAREAELQALRVACGGASK